MQILPLLILINSWLIQANPIHQQESLSDQEFLNEICCPTVAMVQTGGGRVVHNSPNRNYVDLYETDLYVQKITDQKCRNLFPNRDYEECRGGRCRQVKSSQPVLSSVYEPGVGYFYQVVDVEVDTSCRFEPRS